MIHLTTQQISSYLDSELPEASMELVRLHLSTCPSCTEQFAKMEAQEEVLARVLTHEPGEELLEELIEAVSTDRGRSPRRTAKRPSESTVPSADRAADGPGFDRRRSERLDVEGPGEGAPGRGRREADRREVDSAEIGGGPAPSAPRAGIWIAASLAMIAASLAFVVWRHPLPRTASRGVRVPAEAPDAGPTSRPQVREHATDALAILEGAARASAEAERAGTPEAYEGAAAAWVRALPSLHGDVAEEAAGRQELMEARYRAWTLAPTGARREAAIEAVRGYLVIAPSDGQRDSAWTWLARLKR